MGNCLKVCYDDEDSNRNQSPTQFDTFDRNGNHEQIQALPLRNLSVASPNIQFYQNEISALPNEEKIETILQNWVGNYEKLECNHYFIQWLFPNRKSGVNPNAHILTDEEAKIISSTPELRERVRRAFKMMLDFYGMKITDNNQFELTEDYEQKLQRLNRKHNHNFLRITRILLALKELGHANLMCPWLKFLANLIYKDKILEMAEDSFERFWIETLDSKDEINLRKYVYECLL